MIRGRPDDLQNTHVTVSRPQRQHRSVLPSPAPSSLPARFRMFRSCEWEVLERSLNILQASDFYWGPLSVGEAHAKLQREPVGTYLVRDSSQGNYLFSLSVRMPTGPVSLRISFQEGYFRLKNWFSDCVVRLLELVVAGTRNNPLHFDEMGGTPLVFSEPLCRSRQTVPTLQELCRQRLPGGCQSLPAATGQGAGSSGMRSREEVASPPSGRGGSEQNVVPCPSLAQAGR
ncbi:suppressor of cytokine signaling 1-like [Apteryx mantelli]|uniref:Suppressor of cytokine signaling 1-like n=1 Tax=Apteryx mantelli TaxID=2696672 RepID=A0A8B7IV21_9AVES|nr:PREDICTED: suppressor of cytokine signaling 1-like [Apteryx mantelli mantelli]XP_013802766.1 PREDICTED: suppressor of cytokine signaling 1-like [Apteryx mantelli mantelli]XP_013802767.1 PREDICTED: suppressor of cytokine signaling 1-like [Apteryx mantelli mantelli]XP_025924954.1 suppressor of cytokine signaling 1-like [Apteryx rowi]XP_025924955.1 suppressor of cytokine signaling 1-like [Apteryx rowi]XP_025924956.1 suppressor of cytokine signaling 1-like [Apteryx rowi]XP_025924957.1 suppress